MSQPNGYGLVSTHWALGTLILVGLASSELTGGATIVALPIAALAVTLAAACEPFLKLHDPAKRRRCTDAIEFLEIWMNVLELLTAAATCARIASATMDYVSRGRFRDWLFGIESHSLGEPWPDVLGVTVMVVATGLFMLGLDKSPSLCLLLYLGLGVGFVFFVVTGSFYTDTKFWSWTHDFNVKDWKNILTASALCVFAFPNTVLDTEAKLCLKYSFLLIVPLVGYTTIVLVFTLMSHFRELAGTAIPLVRVFEMRDVDWARPIMATCTIFVGCIALTEIMPALYRSIMRLASREWRILVSSLMYRNPLSGAPVLAIFTAGSLASILAFACPLSYLVRLLNAAPLIKCALRCSRALHARYKVENVIHEDLSVQNTNIQYSRLQGAKRPSPMRRLKTSLDMVPRFLRNTKANVEDKEYLLMDNYVRTNDELEEIESPSESSDRAGDDEFETSSSTDIDAVVQEYKDQIQVTTVNTFADAKGPSHLTSRSATAMIGFIYIFSSLISVGVYLHLHHFIWPSSIGILIIATVILLLPQNRPNLIRESTVKTYRAFLPCAAITSMVFSIILAAMLLVEVWFGVVMWILAGLILFFRCECCNCEGLYPTVKERQRLHAPSKSECPTFSHEHNEHLDAVLITR